MTSAEALELATWVSGGRGSGGGCISALCSWCVEGTVSRLPQVHVGLH